MPPVSLYVVFASNSPFLYDPQVGFLAQWPSNESNIATLRQQQSKMEARGSLRWNDPEWREANVGSLLLGNNSPFIITLACKYCALRFAQERFNWSHSDDVKVAVVQCAALQAAGTLFDNLESLESQFNPKDYLDPDMEHSCELRNKVMRLAKYRPNTRKSIQYLCLLRIPIDAVKESFSVLEFANYCGLSPFSC